MSKYQFAALLITIVITQIWGVTYLGQRQPMPAPPVPDQSIDALRQEIAELKQLQLSNTPHTGEVSIRLPEPEHLRQAIDQALQASLAAILEKNQPGQQKSINAALLPQPLEQQTFAYEQALTALDTAVTNGIWTEENNRALLPYSSILSPQQHAEFNRRFTQAVNNGAIKLDGPPPLY